MKGDFYIKTLCKHPLNCIRTNFFMIVCGRLMESADVFYRFFYLFFHIALKTITFATLTNVWSKESLYEEYNPKSIHVHRYAGYGFQHPSCTGNHYRVRKNSEPFLDETNSDCILVSVPCGSNCT